MTSASAPSKPNRQRRLRQIQIMISLILLMGLIWYIDWATVWYTLRTASIKIIGLGFVLYLVGVVFSSSKWQIILHIEQIHVPLQRLIRWYLIGAFASNFLPSDIGGDVGRGIYAARYTGRAVAVTRSIVMERLTGFTITLLFAATGMIVLLGHWEMLVSVVALASTGFAVLWFVGRRDNRDWPKPVQRITTQLGQVLRQYRLHPRQFVSVMMMSTLFQILAGAGLWINYRAIHVSLPFISVILVAAIVNTAGVLPISINGWGVRESLLIGLLAPFAVSADQIVAGALLSRILTLCGSLLGVLPLALEPHTGPPEPATGELTGDES